MLVERGLKVMNVEAVGDAYAIAANFLRRSGVIPDTYDNKLRLANRAIAQFQAVEREVKLSGTHRTAL